jgi:hypothetical protein
MKSQQYRSYLLRIWQADDEDEPVWRAQIECPSTGERRGFACLQDLYRFLDEQTAAGSVRDDRVCGDKRWGAPGP